MPHDQWTMPTTQHNDMYLATTSFNAHNNEKVTMHNTGAIRGVTITFYTVSEKNPATFTFVNRFA